MKLHNTRATGQHSAIIYANNCDTEEQHLLVWNVNLLQLALGLGCFYALLQHLTTATDNYYKIIYVLIAQNLLSLSFQKLIRDHVHLVTHMHL